MTRYLNQTVKSNLDDMRQVTYLYRFEKSLELILNGAISPKGLGQGGADGFSGQARR